MISYRLALAAALFLASSSLGYSEIVDELASIGMKALPIGPPGCLILASAKDDMPITMKEKEGISVFGIGPYQEGCPKTTNAAGQPATLNWFKAARVFDRYFIGFWGSGSSLKISRHYKGWKSDTKQWNIKYYPKETPRLPE